MSAEAEDEGIKVSSWKLEEMDFVQQLLGRKI